MPRFKIVRDGPYIFEREAEDYEAFMALAAESQDKDWTPVGPAYDDSEEYEYNEETRKWEAN